MSEPAPGTGTGGGGAPFPPRVRRALLLRSLAIQGSWNYQTLIGTGLAWMLAPALRHVYGGDPQKLRAAVARHAELFNSHPYLVTVAAGAIARLEADGAPPELVGRFKAALRGSLGTLGDRLVWLRWRPAAVLLGVALVLAGAPWWVGVAAFLAVYNALHLWLRAWGLRTGLRDGLNVGRAVRDAPLQALGERAGDAGAALAGLAAVLMAGGAGHGGWHYVFAAAAIVLGVALGARVRAAVFVVLLATLAAGVVLAGTS